MSRSTFPIFFVLIMLVMSGTLTGCNKAMRAPSVLTADYVLQPNEPVRGVTRGKYFDSIVLYSRVLIEGVTIYPAQGVRLDPEVAIRLSEQFRRELVSRYANDFEIVQLPGAGVMRVQASVIDVKPSYGFGMEAADMEALVTDSVTGEAILALRDNRRHLIKSERSRVSEWENARLILQKWGKLIGDETLALQPPPPPVVR